ncbi:hypothetical protein EBU99_07775 [bacterium]|nr:hypothetical protein [bacterium]
MTMNRFAIAAMGLMTATAFVSGCGKKKSTSVSELSEGAAINISGQISLASSETSVSLTGDELNATDVSLTDLKVYCVSFSFPPKAGTGTVGADGSFSLSIEANDVAVGCFVLNGTTTVATMTFEDSAAKNVDGAAKSDSRLAFSGDTNMGKISLDTATGKAKADVNNFKAKVRSFEGAGFDFSGTWAMSKLDSVPEGYGSICAPGQQNCEGPHDGEKIFLKRITGKKEGKDVFAAQIWESEDKFKACGSALGIKSSEALAKVGIDFSGSGLADGPFTWNSSWGVDGWKNVAATSQREMRPCSPGNINGVPVMKCSATYNSATVYEVNVNTNESGCKNSDGSPVDMKDWSGWTAGSAACVEFAKIPGLQTCSNTFTKSGKSITCKGTGGVLDSSNNKVTITGGTSLTRSSTAKDTSCSSLSGIQQLQCYADYYFANRDSAQGCVRDVQLNWGTDDASKFVTRTDGPTRAVGEYVMNLINYSGANTVSIRDESEEFRGMQVKNGQNEGFVNCKIVKSITLSMTKLTDTSMQMELVQTMRSTDRNPACSAQTGGEQGRSQKFMFKATKI